MHCVLWRASSLIYSSSTHLSISISSIHIDTRWSLWYQSCSLPSLSVTVSLSFSQFLSVIVSGRADIATALSTHRRVSVICTQWTSHAILCGPDSSSSGISTPSRHHVQRSEAWEPSNRCSRISEGSNVLSPSTLLVARAPTISLALVFPLETDILILKLTLTPAAY